MPPHPGPPLRSDLAEIPRYVPGTAPRALAGQEAFKLSANEVATPMTRTVASAAMAAAAGANRYPDNASTALVDRLATLHGVPGRQVVVGGGSITVLQQLVQAAINPGDAVVFAWRSYEAYPIIARTCHALAVPVPLTAHRHDLAAMARRAIETDARLAIVCNPNNPTGTSVTRAELIGFLDTVPTTCLIVLDEAYREFVTDPAVPDGIDLATGRPNVVVLRTFSKAHALAGLRVGYAVCPPEVADAVRAVALPFTVSAVAQQAAIAALDHWQEQRAVVADITRRRGAFRRALAGAGIDVCPSQANFVWLPHTPRTARLADSLAENGISVRAFGQEGIRVTIGEPPALARVVKLATLLS